MCIEPTNKNHLHPLMDLRNLLKEAAKDLVSRAKKHGMKSRYAYARMLAELESSNTPIYSVDCVKGAGVKTRRFFTEYLSKKTEMHRCAAGSEAEDNSLVVKKLRTAGMCLNMDTDTESCRIGTPQESADAQDAPGSRGKPRNREWECISKAMEGRRSIVEGRCSGDGMAMDFVVPRNGCRDAGASRDSTAGMALDTESTLCEKGRREHTKKTARQNTGKSVCVTESVEKEVGTVSDLGSYMPGYRTGAYAILKVLSEEDGLTRNQICFRGVCYSDTEFNPRLRYSAWSAMRTLISKGLVFNEDRPVRYYISKQGWHVAQKLPNDATAAKKTPQKGIVLMIDSREMKSKKVRSFFQNELSDLGVSVETVNLEVGDFLWVKDDVVLNYIVERKHGADFVSSITDGRLQEQMERLKASGIRNIFYVIEGLRRRHMARIGCNFGQTMLSMLKMQGVTAIETESAKETVNILHMIDSVVRHKDLLISGNISEKRAGTGEPADLGEEMAAIHRNLSNMSLSDIKVSSYESFMYKGTKNRDFDAKEFFYRSLLCVKGVSHEKACAVSTKYRVMRSFLSASCKPEFFEELSTVDVGGKELGRILAARMCNLFGIHIQECSGEK